MVGEGANGVHLGSSVLVNIYGCVLFLVSGANYAYFVMFDLVSILRYIVNLQYLTWGLVDTFLSLSTHINCSK